MVRRPRETFQETLLAVAQHNVQVLESKATIAASLGRVCPEYEGALIVIETRALAQMFRILADMGNSQDDLSTVNKWRLVRCPA